MAALNRQLTVQRDGAGSSPARDLLALGKPTITLTTLITCAAGFALARAGSPALVLLCALGGTGLVVASANAFNMVLERDSDARMARTRQRPLPAGRLSPALATAAAALMGVAGVGLLAAAVNGLTAWLALASLIAYAFVYTPLKRYTPLALVIGAVPGAMPPLLGWTAATDRLDAPGLALFLVLFVWQIPHFLAIAIRCRADYAQAGIRAVTVVHGEESARLQAMVYSTVLIPVSLLFPLLGVAGPLYGATAALLGVGMLAISVQSFRTGAPLWDKRLFFASLVYLPVLMFALALDVTLL